MKLEYIIDEDITIKEFIYKRISRNFYGYLKEHNVIYTVNEVVTKAHEIVLKGSKLVITYNEEKQQDGILSNEEITIVAFLHYMLLLI